MNKKMSFLLGFTPNPRMKKRIEALEGTYSIDLIYMNKGNQFLSGNIMPEVRRHEISVSGKRKDLLTRMKDYASFFRAAKRILMDVSPEYVYVQNLDMLIIACNYAKRRGKNIRIICEIADISPLLTDRQESILGKVVQQVLRLCDKHFLKKVDLLVCTSEQFYETYYHRYVPKEKYLFFPNIPDLKYFQSYRKEEHDGFTVGFVGLVRFKKQMELLTDAVQKMGIYGLFAGSEIDEGDDISIEAICKNSERLTFLGRYNYEMDISKIYASIDVVYAVYDTSQMDIRIALPNKLYEAVYCELPIIVARNTYLAEVVEDWGVGVAVDDCSEDELMEVLERMRRERGYYDRLVDACRRKKGMINIEIYNTQLQSRIKRLSRKKK